MPKPTTKRPGLILMGTPDFGVPAFSYLVEKGFPVSAVITQPDKPKGRGHHESMPAVKQMALELGLTVLQPDNVNDPGFLKQLQELPAEVIVVVAFGQILKSQLLHLLPLGCVNLHGSLLPKYRGAAPIQWAIAHGEKETGLTVQLMAEQVDSGPILQQQKLNIGPDENYPQVYGRLANLGGPLMAAALEKLAAVGPTAAVPQDESQATFAPRLRRENGLINWQDDAGQIYNYIRAFYPWPGTYTFAAGERLKIITAARTERRAPAGMPPGSILEVGKEQGWLVAAGNGSAIQIKRVQCENAQETTAQAFTCGYRIKAGSVLGLRGE